MEIEKTKEFLQTHPGYLKWSSDRIAKRFGISVQQIDLIKLSLKTGIDIKNGLNILFLDIETSPLAAYIWGMWEQSLYHLEQLSQDWFMLSFAYKWIDSKNIESLVLTPEEVKEENDKRLTLKLWQLLEQADVVVTHNGDKFDLRRINTRFLKYGLGPVAPYKSVDTLKIAKKYFNISSNKLEYLATFFNIPGKLSSDFILWKECIEGNEEALAILDTYCKQDVNILEQIYFEMKPWIKEQPNLGLLFLDQIERCPSCGSTKLTYVGYAYTSVNRYRTYRCEMCHAISRNRTTETTAKQRTGVLILVR